MCCAGFFVCVCVSAGGPAVWHGGGTGFKGGTLAAVGGQAAEHGHLSKAGAGAGEGAAQQGGTVATKAPRWCQRFPSNIPSNLILNNPKYCKRDKFAFEFKFSDVKLFFYLITSK